MVSVPLKGNPRLFPSYDPPPWPHVFCYGDRVAQIQVQNLGLKGPFPQNLNQLSKLFNLGLQKNHFNGKLSTFSGLSELEFAYLDNNEFNTIPADFFDGLSSVRVLALDYNPFNKTTGWSIPNKLANSAQLTNLSLVNCNVVGPLPEFLGEFPSLAVLKLSYNRLSGEILDSSGESLMQILWLNYQDSEGMTGTIDIVANMVSLKQLWLHGNRISGAIPENIGNLTSLKDLNLNRNQIIGLIPWSLADMRLDNLVLNNNHLIGRIPKIKAGNFSYDSNLFCQSKPGIACAPEVDALLDFLGGMNYPINLVSQWSGNEPCVGLWMGGNYIHGTVPENLTDLGTLRTLDLSDNNLEPQTISLAPVESPPSDQSGAQVVVIVVQHKSHTTESGNLVISVQVLWKGTNDFAGENELSRGGFETVYKGVLEDGTQLAVKRMEAGIISIKALDEFQSKIAILSKVQLRHLVSLLSFSIEAKVSNFGLVKLVPDGEKSMATSLAGTFRYLAPEYAVMGKISAKVDVFSYGVVLMELVTRLTALDEGRSEETRYLAEWYGRIKSNKDKLMAEIDPALEVNEETYESIATIAELACHCTARDPYHQPDMGHAMNEPAPLVEKWKPVNDESKGYSGIDYDQPLPHMLKVWQAAENRGVSYTSLDDRKGSIPAKPVGFADSFTSINGR
ncbi:histone deacetylase 8-like isoform X1 [Hibiscus syriacus]|uniref:Histone deacetylase 8-like isoform X1 n=1 Tax=Hibiscus syriacus TaxID=106335 RepID=A0A6A2WSK1_HIBSY|nr:histone deacetylase 8-like isoform X1 [Hibiscus syriacus]